ncbi:hypothetical protein Q5752_003751 [Cryptotrichosporon argae]
MMSAAFAGMSKEDSAALRQKLAEPLPTAGMLYPPLTDDKVAILQAPSAHDDRIVAFTTELNRDMASGPVDAATCQRTGAPWRLASTTKTVTIQIESYSDRFAASARAEGTAELDAGALHLDKALFPPSLWAVYFEKQADGRAAFRTARKRRRLDGDDEDKDEDAESSPESIDDDFDFEDTADDEAAHQDYDANYFNNGEDDDDDGGDDGDEGGGGGYDD